MAEDILAELREKEDEMEALISEAREKAAHMREEALKSARAISEKASAEADEEVRAILSSERASIAQEASRIEEDGSKEADRLREKGLRNTEKVVSEVMRFLIESIRAGK